MKVQRPNHICQGGIRMLITLLVLGLALSVPPSAHAATTITVTTTADELNSDGDCALREAIRAANLDAAVDQCPAGSGADTITVPGGTYTLTRSGVDHTAEHGDLDLTGTLTLVGAGAATTIIDGNRIDRVFDVRSAATVTIRNVTLSRGSAASDAVIDPLRVGGGIRNAGTVMVHDSIFIFNGAEIEGGAIHNSAGSATLINTVLQNNGAYEGGGIANDGTMTIDASLIDKNGQESSEGGGANILNRGSLHITNSTISGGNLGAENSGHGAGIANRGGSLSLDSSVIKDNNADWGAALFSDGGTVTINRTDIHNNAVINGCGGAIFNSAVLTVTHSRIADNKNANIGGAGGGAICNGGTLTISDTTMSGNVVRGSGGAIFNVGSVTLSRSTLSGNRALLEYGGGEQEGGGGAIANGGTIRSIPPTEEKTISGPGSITIDNSTISDNLSAINGGAIVNSGTLRLDATTVDHNTSAAEDCGEPGRGGGIYSDNGKVTLNKSTLSRNRAASNNECNDAGFGGGIFNTEHSTVEMTASSVISNTAHVMGGGIDNSGSLSMIGSTVLGNEAFGRRGGEGGGIASSGTLTIADSMVSNNQVSGGLGLSTGGAIFNVGTATLTNSTISGNTAIGQQRNSGAGVGGGIANTGTMALTNSTISGNVAQGGSDESAHHEGGRGGGIANLGAATLTLASSTVSGNHAQAGAAGSGVGGGIANGSGAIRMSNTIIADNTAPAAASGFDCSGTVQSQGYNLIEQPAGCTITGDITGNRLNVDPRLGSLQNNGGPTPTHALLPDSPALDAGSPAAPGSSGSACPATDQRGMARPQDGNGDGVARCDIGAYEAEASQQAGPQERIVALKAEVEQLVARRVLNRGQGHALISKLDAALYKLKQGKPRPALNQLQAFVKQVEAYQKGRILSAAQAQPLVQAANTIIDQLRR